MFFKHVYSEGDKLEDKVRRKLSHYPILYALIGGIGIVIFWRGVWHSADYLVEHFFVQGEGISSMSGFALPWWDGPVSVVLGFVLLLTVGLFVASFIGDAIIISGLRSEKKLNEKTEEELALDVEMSKKIQDDLREIREHLGRIEDRLDHHGK